MDKVIITTKRQIKMPDQPIVRLTRSAMEELVDLANQTGKPIGTLASEIIHQVIEKDLIEIRRD